MQDLKLDIKYYARVEVSAGDKHSSLLGKGPSCTKGALTLTRGQFCKTFYGRKLQIFVIS